jgi:hypothetical protein
MGLSLSPVIANYLMEYFEKNVSGSGDPQATLLVLIWGQHIHHLATLTRHAG